MVAAALAARCGGEGPHERGNVPLPVEVNTRDDLDGDDRGGNPVDDEAERGPPPGVRNELTSVLPEILEPVARKADYEQPWRFRDGRGSDNDEDPATLVSKAMTTQRPSATAKPM